MALPKVRRINRSADVPWKLFHIAKYPGSIYMTQFVRNVKKIPDAIENCVHLTRYTIKL
jgi:hypothetical protein